VRLASTIFRVPIAIISLVDTDRIWFKSHHGLSINQIGRDPGLCASAILSTDSYVVENAVDDARTLANPLVAGEFGLRFYAAAPLRTDENFNLGTLCIIDQQPRKFTDEEKDILVQLAAVVMDEMEMRLAVRGAVEKIKKISSDLGQHLQNTIRDVKASPMSNADSSLTSYLEASGLYLKNVEHQLNAI
jgi:GAF domain-containing protein